MKTKLTDELYCGINKEKLKAKLTLSSKFLKVLNWFIKERYEIHLKKDVQKLNAPWTTNEHFQKYKYTNIRREHDRESKYLIQHVSENQNLSYKNKLLNSFLFRLINNHKTFEKYSFPFDFNSLNFKEISKIKIEGPIYNTAFIVTGHSSVIKKQQGDSSVLSVIKFVKSNEKQILLKSKNQLEAYNNLIKINGIGKFLAYQIFLDFTYIKEYPFSENEFTKAGPGCVKGLDLLFSDKKNLNHEELLFWLRNNQIKVFSLDFNNLFSDLKEFDRVLNIGCLENIFCEFYKYCRSEVLNSTKPKKLYKYNS